MIFFIQKVLPKLSVKGGLSFHFANDRGLDHSISSDPSNFLKSIILNIEPGQKGSVEVVIHYPIPSIPATLLSRDVRSWDI